ncbi:MAG TPA: UDPGP type 1 family protein, partial [Phycisphaerae bacterium]|nr:UDPGP type 1 family protein [Phycisphaerae bacterium]
KPSQRRQLLDDLSCINVKALPELVRLAMTGQTTALPNAALLPVQVIPRESVGTEVVARGRSLLEAGKVAAFTVAGGQGTRLGFDGPKGAFPISPVRNKPLFQIFAEGILATDRRYGCRTQWYIMTSPANDAETRQFFREHSHFGMEAGQVTFFQQGVMPAFDQDGRILLDEKHRLTLAPDGHGGSLLALARTGMLADMAERGVEYISYFQVDNPLVMCLDPVFIGLHAAHKTEMSSKALPKADDLERVGNFAMAGGRQMVIEYSDLPDELAHARNPDGSRKFDAGNIAIHLLSRSFVERLTADPASFALPWHKARKKVPYVDLTSGRRIEPAEPNAIKLESFVFDALPLAKHPVVMGTSRAEEFSPVKNATGVDSVDTARRDTSRRAARWLEVAGFKVPRNAAGEPDAVFEISPLLALDAEQLGERNLPRRTFERGTKNYLE